MLGLGVWQVPNGSECVNAVRWALDLGYRHLDTAQAYGNERSVGEELRQSGLPRDDVFITTKFFPGGSDPAGELENSLRRLGVEYVALYLIPLAAGRTDLGLAGNGSRAGADTRARSASPIFSASELEELSGAANDWPPTVNQVEFSPFEYRKALLRDCDDRDIVLEAYSPLGTGRHLDAREVAAIATALGVTPAQVLLRWCVQRQIPVIPKSTNHDRIATTPASSASSSPISRWPLSMPEM